MKYLIVVDMLNDFITGSLGTREAEAILPKVIEKVKNFDGTILYTKDTHQADYMATQEGKNLPVEHCIEGSRGWMLADELEKLSAGHKVFKKLTFGSVELAKYLVEENKEIREEIKNNLNEILIDEYQDTNDVQEEFISYIANNNVYMVGDIKQSIYRFRNANPYIFKNKYDNYSNNNGGIKIDLNKNFRSREEVIGNINLMFDRIMDDIIGGADYSKTHQMIFGNMMYKGEGDNNQNNNFEVYSYLNDTNYKKEEVEAFILCWMMQ